MRYRQKRRRTRSGTVEMQMGPMIDMVFLLLVFFMVSAKPVKPESDIPMGLPGQVSQEERVDIPDEARIIIQPDGQIVLNEQALDSPKTQDLPELRAVLVRFKKAADSAKADALVTLAPHDTVPHQRLVDVLNTCAEAGITGVTLAGATEGE
ncbi:MAG: biopolymer transporter ExbD [Verrucomicrobiales bacterium]|nr:biopolymer transporter ExbD [Verrucomicrobiales bacterium]